MASLKNSSEPTAPMPLGMLPEPQNVAQQQVMLDEPEAPLCQAMYALVHATFASAAYPKWFETNYLRAIAEVHEDSEYREICVILTTAAEKDGTITPRAESVLMREREEPDAGFELQFISFSEDQPKVTIKPYLIFDMDRARSDAALFLVTGQTPSGADPLNRKWP